MKTWSVEGNKNRANDVAHNLCSHSVFTKCWAESTAEAEIWPRVLVFRTHISA